MDFQEMSSMENNHLPPIPGRVVIAYDATKNRNERELKRTVDSIRLRGDILHGGDTLKLLGVVHKVPHPMGYQMQASPVSFLGTNMSVLKEEVSKKIDMCVNMLLQSAEECKNEKVDIEVMVTAGTPIQKVVLEEVTACNATWVVLDRHLRRDLSFYLKQISSKVALIRDNLSVKVLRPYTTIDTGNVEHRVVYSISKLVPLSAVQDNENNEQSVIFGRSCSASMTSLKSSNRSFMENNPLIPGRVVIAYDATKDRKERELQLTVDNLRLKGDILHGGDTLMLLGVLHRLPHPMGYQMQASHVSFMGTNMSVMKNEVSKKIDMYVDMLLQSAEECKDEKVDIEVMVTAGTPIQKVVLQEVTTCNATWVVLDRHLRRDLRFYLKHISSKVALINDNLSVEVFRSYTTTCTDNVERRVVYSISKPVPLSAVQDNENNEQSDISCRSCSASMTSSKSSAILENNLTSSFTHRSREHHFSSGDLGSTSKQEKSGRLKLNTDGSRRVGGDGGFGGLIRDERGTWVCGYYGKLHSGTSLEAELWAVYKGLTIILQKGMNQVMIETNAEQVVQWLQEEPGDKCPFKNLVEDAQILLRGCDCSVQHVWKEGNLCADLLAKMGANQPEEILVMNDPPAELRELLVADMMGLGRMRT